MVDTPDLKSVDCNGRTGSSPVDGTLLDMKPVCEPVRAASLFADTLLVSSLDFGEIVSGS